MCNTFYIYHHMYTLYIFYKVIRCNLNTILIHLFIFKEQFIF